MMQLSMIFTIKRSAVGMQQLPGYWILSPVSSHGQSSLVWLCLAVANVKYNSPICDILCSVCWYLVLVYKEYSVGTLSSIPQASQPILFPNEYCQSLYLGFVTSYLYSNSFPVSLSNIAPKNLLLMVETLGRLGLFSYAAHMHSCVMVTCFVFDCMFSTGPTAIASWVKGYGCWCCCNLWWRGLADAWYPLCWFGAAPSIVVLALWFYYGRMR